MMAETIGGLQVAATLARFLEQDALPGTGIEPDVFWRGVAASMPFRARQPGAAGDARHAAGADRCWHDAHPGPPSGDAYRAFLRESVISSTSPRR